MPAPSPSKVPAPLPDVRLSPSSMTVGFWLVHDRAGEHLDLDAPYQRGSVWTLGQRRLLIRSLFTGIPVGAVIASKLDFDEARPSLSYRVIDGKQRVETVRAFHADGFTVPGWWFRPDDLDEGLRDGDVVFSQLTERGQRSFTMSCPLPMLEFDARVEWLGRDEQGRGRRRRRSAAEVLAAEVDLYLLVNTAGTAHTDTDLDRARLLSP